MDTKPSGILKSRVSVAPIPAQVSKSSLPKVLRSEVKLGNIEPRISRVEHWMAKNKPDTFNENQGRQISSTSIRPIQESVPPSAVKIEEHYKRGSQARASLGFQLQESQTRVPPSRGSAAPGFYLSPRESDVEEEGDKTKSSSRNMSRGKSWPKGPAKSLSKGHSKSFSSKGASKSLSKGPARNISKGPSKTPSKHFPKDSSKLSSRDPTKVSTRDPTKDFTKDHTEDSLKDPVKYSLPKHSNMSLIDSTKDYSQDPTRDLSKDPTKGFSKDPTKDYFKESKIIAPKDVIKDPSDDLSKELSKVLLTEPSKPTSVENAKKFEDLKLTGNVLVDSPTYLVRAPFGVRTKRFGCLGFHPDLDPSGSMKKDKGTLGPGQYNPEPYECPYKKYMLGGSPWLRKKNMEEYSRELGFKFPRILEERRLRKSQGGPGANDINYDLFTKQTSSNKKNVDFGSQKKFYTPIKNDNPSPNTYFKDLNKTSTLMKKIYSPLPSFEWDGFVCRFKGVVKSWQLPPNRYKPKDPGSIDQLLAKKVSSRGPYDLFTGPRDDSTIKNHFAPGTFKGPENYFFTWPNEIDTLLRHPRKSRTGKFLKGDRFPKYPTVRTMLDDLSLCYRDPNLPSPATYNVVVDTIKKLPESKYPFNDSVLQARKGFEWKIHPGPGRYSIRYPKCKEKKRESWVFKSKAQRNMHKVEDYRAF